MRIWRNQEIEQRTANRLAEYRRLTGRELQPPVPIEAIAEQLMDLSFVWDTLNHVSAVTILAGLIVNRKEIVLNLALRQLFEQKPGLLRFTIGHEVGHWDLFEQERFLAYTNPIPGLNNSKAEWRCSRGVLDQILKYVWVDDQVYDFCSRTLGVTDTPEVKTAVNSYASAILMPQELLLPAIRRQGGVKHWRDIYRLAEQFHVSATAMKVRLLRLNIITETPDKEIFSGTKEEYAGQGRLF